MIVKLFCLFLISGNLSGGFAETAVDPPIKAENQSTITESLTNIAKTNVKNQTEILTESTILQTIAPTINKTNGNAVSVPTVNPNSTALPTTTVAPPITTASPPLTTTTATNTTTTTTVIPTTAVPSTTNATIIPTTAATPNITAVPTTNATSTTTEGKPTSTEEPKSSTVVPVLTTNAPPAKDRRFDGPSFIGGIVLSLGTLAIGFVALKFYKARTEVNYHTL